ncbi:hemoglobin subunit beta-4-like [Oncorhynchus masou masou]|uniref:hemoglobin subunit beta-4-like n=1 Tax=Oncorhynchus masou masou TaxID=90313 RepID=UPI003182BC04
MRASAVPDDCVIMPSVADTLNRSTFTRPRGQTDYQDVYSEHVLTNWQRHFSTFGNLSTPAAIMGNPAVAKHRKTVMHGLDIAVQNLDDIKNTYTALSVMHSEKLHVYPENFKLLADCITVCVAAKLGPAVFSADIQEAFQKFLAVVVSALGRQYH